MCASKLHFHQNLTTTEEGAPLNTTSSPLFHTSTPPPRPVTYHPQLRRIQTSPYPLRPQASSTAQEKTPPPPPQVFTCTFCWRFIPCSFSSPRVIGRSARLAYEACFSAILSLAICWVCGEVCFRDEEVVSLGWCFWHRGCYGCLFCGNKKVVRGWGVGEVYSSEDEGRGKMKEVDVVPLCVNCFVVEDTESEREIVKRAVRRVELADGGLGRARFERGTTGQGQDMIWVNMRNPLGEEEMSFRPSPTKGVPSFLLEQQQAHSRPPPCFFHSA
ncbi:hypothetical protein QBC35DRAFT_381958 [Podospora australis]|uniref:LIM zinc-binding domain-containing protein n=1 Tax=Podospora australis TaxID=1536484 RepID=A0AAN6WY68_9PEZI|nr:hypothetical protein QBC35DRAFT_381958 [Podospora australis]